MLPLKLQKSHFQSEISYRLIQNFGFIRPAAGTMATGITSDRSLPFLHQVFAV
jgi:hypothetical protein